MSTLKLGKLKVKNLLPFIIFPLISFIAFVIWVQALPEQSADSSVALQYAFIYGATIACNNPFAWGVLFFLSILTVAISAVKKLTATYLFTNITLFIIFCLPVFLSITSNVRFCISFLI